jgi:hypothetical protein
MIDGCGVIRLSQPKDLGFSKRDQVREFDFAKKNYYRNTSLAKILQNKAFVARKSILDVKKTSRGRGRYLESMEWLEYTSREKRKVRVTPRSQTAPLLPDPETLVVESKAQVLFRAAATSQAHRTGASTTSETPRLRLESERPRRDSEAQVARWKEPETMGSPYKSPAGHAAAKKQQARPRKGDTMFQVVPR